MSNMLLHAAPADCYLQMADSRYLVLVRATPQQAEQYEADAKAARIAAIHDAAGFAAVFDLMRRSGKPAVGHNCMFDVAYGLYSFADAYLPSMWRDYKKMVNAWHPGGVYDTKYIAKRLPEVSMGSAFQFSLLSVKDHVGCRVGHTL